MYIRKSPTCATDNTSYRLGVTMIVRISFALILAIGAWMVLVSADVDLNNEISHMDNELSENGVDLGPPITVEGRSRRLKRSSWSLPANTSVRYLIDWIIPIAPLNNTFCSLTYDLIFRFVLPTYSSLQTLYQSLGKFEEDKEDNVIDLEFLEEQRANDERRTVYQHVEEIFANHGYDGHTCLLRAMCELAETPLAHHGLLGKVLDLVFTPSILEVPKTMESYLNSNRIKRDATSIPELELLQRPLEDDYTAAYKAGKEGTCWTRYYSCPVSIFKLFTPFGG